MIPEARRLKRGLKDISPLFDDEAPSAKSPEIKPFGGVQSLSVICPGNESQNSYLTSRMASKMHLLGIDCAVISIGDEKKAAVPGGLEESRAKRFVMSLAQFESVCGQGAKPSEKLGSSTFFFDFNYSNPIEYKKIIPVLDKWVLFLQPQLESLSEAFKFIKASLALNRNLEYFAAYDGPDHSQKSGILYERFADIVSRRLGVGVSWFGCCDGKTPGASLNGLSFETLQINPALDSLEKRALAGLVYSELRFKG